MKKYLLILICLSASSAFAQLTVQGSGLKVLAGTSLNINNMVLTPSADLSITNQTISRSATPVPGLPSGASILQVHKFSAPITFSGTIAIKYVAPELNGNTESMLQIAYNPLLTGGVFVTTTGSTTGSAGSYYVSKSALSNVTLGLVTATNANITLPVSLVSFKALATQDCDVKVSWTANTTSSLQSFKLETSVNARDWHTVGAGIAAIPGSASYDITDDNPASGTVYYRLKITDPSGTVNYSDIVSARISCVPSLEISLSPNPVRDIAVLKIINGTLENALVTVSDAAGKVVKTMTFSGASVSVDLSKFSSGVYIVSCKKDSFSQSWKIVHQ